MKKSTTTKSAAKSTTAPVIATFTEKQREAARAETRRRKAADTDERYPSREFVIAGARAEGVPEHVIEALMRSAAKSDGDPGAAHWQSEIVRLLREDRDRRRTFRATEIASLFGHLATEMAASGERLAALHVEIERASRQLQGTAGDTEIGPMVAPAARGIGEVEKYSWRNLDRDLGSARIEAHAIRSCVRTLALVLTNTGPNSDAALVELVASLTSDARAAELATKAVA